MRLLTLCAQDFRNLERVEVSTDARFVMFTGENAQGKTNLLEAVHTLAALKGFRARRNRELLRHGQDAAKVSGVVFDGESRRQLSVELSPTGRKGRVDGKSPAQLEEYFASLRAVVFTPEDVAIVREGPELRRRFLDRAAFTARSGFLEIAQAFRGAMEQKSALLRQERPDRLSLEVFNERLAVAGARLSARRDRLVAELHAPFIEMHGAISGRGKVGLRYVSRLGDGDEAARAERFRVILGENLNAELERGAPLDGPQRDELELTLDGRSARTWGSQGQVRSLALALKLAELSAARRRGARPLFLLDDLSSELDRLRTGRLVDLLASLDLQVLVTSTDPQVLGDQPDQLRYVVEAGAPRPC